MDLLVLVKLERYERGYGSIQSKFSHTVAAIRINKNLKFEFYTGAINKLHESKY